MKEKVVGIWQQYKAGTLTLEQAIAQIKEAINFNSSDGMTDMVMNTEPFPSKLEVIIEEDNVILAEDVSAEEAGKLTELGVLEV